MNANDYHRAFEKLTGQHSEICYLLGALATGAIVDYMVNSNQDGHMAFPYQSLPQAIELWAVWKDRLDVVQNFYIQHFTK